MSVHCTYFWEALEWWLLGIYSQCFHPQASGTEVPPKYPTELLSAQNHLSWLGTVGVPTVPAALLWQNDLLLCSGVPPFIVNISNIPHQCPGIQAGIWEAKDAAVIGCKTEVMHFSLLCYSVFNRSESRSFCVPRCSSTVFYLFLLFSFFLTVYSFPRT